MRNIEVLSLLTSKIADKGSAAAIDSVCSDSDEEPDFYGKSLKNKPNSGKAILANTMN